MPCTKMYKHGRNRRQLQDRVQSERDTGEKVNQHKSVKIGCEFGYVRGKHRREWGLY